MQSGPMSVANPLIQTSLLGEAIENGPVAVFVADENRRYVAVNQAGCTLVGYAREELLALQVDDVEKDVGEWEEMRHAGTIAGTAELTRKDGDTVKFRYVAGSTVVAGMPVYVSVGAEA